MFLSKVISLILTSAFFVYEKPVPVSIVASPSMDEILSYECAKSLATLLQAKAQPGPIFSDGLLALTSVEARDGSHLLILNAGAGTYAARLEHDGVNRLRFEMPTHLAGGPKPYYISYVHGGGLTTDSRVFELSKHRPPLGKDELDYSFVPLARAEKMIEHFDYAIFTTAGKMLEALTEGRITREQMDPKRVENCENISRSSPALARVLRRDLDVVEMMIVGPKVAGRMPASL